MLQAIVFGAGAMGLGLLGDVLSRSKYAVRYVDIDERIVSTLHTHGRYRFNVVGPEPKVVTVEKVDGLSYANEPAITGAISGSDVVFTATGEAALPLIARTLAKGLVERMKRWRPINVVCCENLYDAAALLRGYVIEELSRLPWAQDDYKAKIEDVGYANAMISKMCKKTEYNPMTPSHQAIVEGSNVVIEVEAEGEIVTEREALVEPGMELVETLFLDSGKFEAERDKKVFAHNGGHALLAYLGALKNYSYIRESGMDNEIKAVFYRAIVDEIGKALIRRYPNYLNYNQFREYVNNLFSRMISPYLNDTVERGIRSSLKKIGGHDARLTRAARFSLEQGVTPQFFCVTIAAALIINNVETPELDRALLELCNLSPDKDSELISLITHAYETLTDWQKLKFPILKSHL